MKQKLIKFRDDVLIGIVTIALVLTFLGCGITVLMSIFALEADSTIPLIWLGVDLICFTIMGLIVWSLTKTDKKDGK